MKGKILIFEKSIETYLDLCAQIKESGFLINEGLNNFEKQKFATKSSFKHQVIEEIRNSSKDNLSGILCNYYLAPDLKGTELIKYIRNYFLDCSDVNILSKDLPIIGYSTRHQKTLLDKINDWRLEKLFIFSGANLYFNTNELENIGKVFTYLKSKSDFIPF